MKGSKYRCHGCDLFRPPAECRDNTIRSGRCGDWVWYVFRGKQLRRRYVRPKDAHTLAQARSRGRLSAASSNYSSSLTDQQQDACTAKGAKVHCRKRLGDSGTLTGQQYWVRKDSARIKAKSKVTKANFRSQPPQPQPLPQATWGPHAQHTGRTPAAHRLPQGQRPKAAAGNPTSKHRQRKPRLLTEVLQNQTVTLSTGPRHRSPTATTPARVARHSTASSALRRLRMRKPGGNVVKANRTKARAAIEALT